jgi:membrane associated rhomboid family serine protease
MTTYGTPNPGPGADPQAATCYRHPDRTTYVRCTRCDRPICAECMRPAAVGFQCPDDVAAGRAEQRPLRNQFGTQLRASRPYVTLTFIAINVVCFILQGFPISTVDPNRQQFTDRFDSFNFSIGQDHEYYRLLTGTFLHVAIWHIAVNMLALIMVGPALEAMLGRIRFIALYLLAGIGGSALAFVVKGPLYDNLGASGAIFGMFAAYWVLARRVRADTSQITGTIVLNLIISVAVPGISLFGHVGGLIVGAMVGAVFGFLGRRPAAVQAGGIAVVALIIVAAVAIRSSVTYPVTTLF